MSAAGDVVSVLAVTAMEDEIVFLQHLFSHSNWKLDHVRTCQEAIAFLRAHMIPVVVCSGELPDATWRDLYAETSTQPCCPRLIVIAAAQDEQLWTDVLDIGGFDVLVKPFDPREAVRVISLAWRQWRHTREREHVGEGER